MALKYTMTFYTPDNLQCKVDLHIDGYTGETITLNPAEFPFVLQEYNTEDDIFKPIRGQQATINFIANSSINIDDFYSNSDTYCRVYFYFVNMITPYWVGYTTQDDYQQEWTNQIKVITLKATDGLGLLKSQQFGEGSAIEGYYTPFYYILYCLNNTAAYNIRYLNVVNSLFNTTSDNTSPVNPLAQLYIDAKTFSIGDGEYDDKYTVLEKINKAYNQTLFQYRGRYYIFRIEELYCPTTTNYRIYSYDTLGFPDQWSFTTGRYDIEIGVNESIMPIEPRMLKMINRNVKKTEVDFFYSYPSEFITNQNFKRGSLTSSSSTEKIYTVNDWYAYKGTFASPVATTQDHYRKDVLDANGVVTDSYIYMVQESSGYNWWQSSPVNVYKNDVIDLSFLVGVTANRSSNKKLTVAYVVVRTSASTGYYLDDDGNWTYYGSLSNANKSLTIKFDSNNLLEANRYLEKSILSKPIPADGFLEVILYNNISWKFSQLQFRYQGALGNITTANIAGHKEYYVKDGDIRFNVQDQIYLADIKSNTNIFGSLVFYQGIPGSILPSETPPTWYRIRYNSERFSFLRQNITAQYNFNKFNRTKIDGTFYGLYQNSKPIGLLNTVVFTDDDPNKIYYIANMKEINFAAGTWSATLMEVWDNDRDTTTATTYPTYTREFLYK